MRTRSLSVLALLAFTACSSPSSKGSSPVVDDEEATGAPSDPSEPLQSPKYRVFEGGKVVEKSNVDARNGGFGDGSGARGRAADAPGAPPPLATAAAAAGEMDMERGVAPRQPAMGGGQAATRVMSGEWDDNANYREFMKYLATTPTTRAFDVKNRRFIRVSDVDGMPVPNCTVTVHGDGRDLDLTTTSGGRALFFPHAEGFEGGTLVAKASCAGKGDVSFNASDDDGVVELKLDGQRTVADERVVDIVFVLDTTGSMSEEIEALSSTIQRVAEMLEKEKVTGRFGLVEYKDRTDPFITRTTPMTKDVKRFLERVKEVRASGGGDMPEDVNEGVRTAVQDLAWSSTSVAKLMFVIGDAPPHLDYQDATPYSTSTKDASHRGIVIHTVAASGMDDVGQSVFRQMAQYTGGSAMFVLRGGAGPASVGGGDPKSSCGGTQENFKSGELHRLITNKVYGALTAVDGRDKRIAGLGKDEDAKPCEERVRPVAWSR